ncbi:MAG: glycerophosphodiester phosphodiesterase [Byssovorax sp.]
MTFFSGPRPRLFGHRGSSGTRPENTLLSFREALAAGADHLELDVHGTRDGAIVVFHDPVLDRTTDGTGPIKERTLAELRALDAGFRFQAADGGHPFRGHGCTIPTLIELCESFPGVPLNIEIKQSEPPIIADVLAILDRFGMRESTLLAAERVALMKQIRAAAPDIATAFAAEEVMELLGRMTDATYVPPGRALQVPPSYEGFPIVTADFVARAHALGVEVHVWTINDEPEMDRLLDLGVDGLMSDFPARVAAVFERRGAR